VFEVFVAKAATPAAASPPAATAAAVLRSGVVAPELGNSSPSSVPASKLAVFSEERPALLLHPLAPALLESSAEDLSSLVACDLGEAGIPAMYGAFRSVSSIESPGESGEAGVGDSF